VEEPPYQIPPAPVLELSYAFPDKNFRPARQAFKLACFFGFIALAPVVVCSLLIAAIFMNDYLPAIIAQIIGGAIYTAICVTMMFLGCWTRWRSQGSSLSRRRVWPFAILFIIVAYGLPFLAIPLGDGNGKIKQWLGTAWIVTVLLWPFCFGWFSRYFLLAQNSRVE
jgi:hypothetical protein